MVPATLYVLQNNLVLVAADNLSSPILAVLSQLKIATTAVFSVFFLGKAPPRYSRRQPYQGANNQASYLLFIDLWLLSFFHSFVNSFFRSFVPSGLFFSRRLAAGC